MDFFETKNFKDIYQDMQLQFPPEELKPYEHLKSLAGKNYRVYQVCQTLPVGYILLYETEKFIFIDYIAIYKNFHSQGFGSKILESLKREFNKKGCFLEVEKPDENNPDTIRRIKFYKKHGAGKLDIDYIYPNKQGGLPMDLYYIPFNDENIQQEEIKDFITELFKNLHSDIKDNMKILNKIFD